MYYDKEHTQEINFPIGGIGTGSVGFSGNGMLRDWEIFNHPAKGSLNGYSHLALRAETASGVKMKILNGDMMSGYMGQYGHPNSYQGYGYGPEVATMAGFDHFSEHAFTGEFPFAKLSLSDPDYPAKAEILVFNPMIPNDSLNSSLPAAFFEVAVTNISNEPCDLTAAFVLQNPFPVSRNIALPDGKSILLKNAGAAPADTAYGDLTLSADGGEVFLQEYWYRGGWQDGNATYNNELSGPGLRKRHYDTDGSFDHCTVAVKTHAEKEETVRFRFLLTWNIPNNYNYWDPLKDAEGKDVTWKNFYATVFSDSAASNAYAMKHWDMLYARTLKFHDSLWGTTADPAILDAAASTLSVLHSPTVLRLEDGSFYGWEGSREVDGSCEGSCTHVWNYAYALCYLFPDLERSIRTLDFTQNQLKNGAMRFRMTLPVGRPGGWDMPCVDGQMGGILKLYRDWKLCGDDEWLRKLWPAAKRSLEFAWSEENPLLWDRNKDGVLEGRQHHTLDMELYGPSAWLEGMYLGALKAGAEIALHFGEKEDAALYLELAEKGAKWTEENLFNGQWYIQKIDLHEKSLLFPYDKGTSTLNHTPLIDTYWNPEAEEIKYQIGEGCEIDQCLGEWHALLSGLGSIFDEEHLHTALGSLFKNNYKPTFRGFTNPWRNFYLNDEAGTIMLDFPKGTKKPAIPVPYTEETMHGFEYALAGLLLAKGFREEAMKVVRAVRDRYDGKKRNPFNEMECGNNYARSMASFALLPILSGFRADLPKKAVSFDPLPQVFTDLEEGKNFRCLWSLDGAWGEYRLNASCTEIEVFEGTLRAETVKLPYSSDGAFLLKDHLVSSENGRTLYRIPRN